MQAEIATLVAGAPDLMQKSIRTTSAHATQESRCHLSASGSTMPSSTEQAATPAACTPTDTCLSWGGFDESQPPPSHQYELAGMVIGRTSPECRYNMWLIEIRQYGSAGYCCPSWSDSSSCLSTIGSVHKSWWLMIVALVWRWACTIGCITE
jgi:hypothetical protein